MRIKEIMAQPVVTAREQTSLEEIAALMLQHHVGCVPVVDGRGQLCGIGLRGQGERSSILDISSASGARKVADR